MLQLLARAYSPERGRSGLDCDPVRSQAVRTLPRAAPLVTAVIFAAAPALAASPAGAATATYSVQYLTLGNGHKVVARWNPCRTHTYKVNLAAVPTATRTTVLAETQAALRVLATKTGISFTYKGATTEVPRAGTLRHPER